MDHLCAWSNRDAGWLEATDVLLLYDTFVEPALGSLGDDRATSEMLQQSSDAPPSDEMSIHAIMHNR